MHRTPYLEMDVAQIEANICLFKHINSPYPLSVRYAAKANSLIPVLRTMQSSGVKVGVASALEAQAALDAGFAPADIRMTNPILHMGALSDLSKLDVTQFVVDDHRSVEKIIAAYGPSVASVLIRVDLSSRYASSSCAGKFGAPLVCVKYFAQEIMQRSSVNFIGLAFQTGSQLLYPDWERVISAASGVFKHFPNIRNPVLCVGGGFPVEYGGHSPIPEDSLRNLSQVLGRRKDLPQNTHIEVEPGRALVANAGRVISKVLAVRNDPANVYIDAGIYSGFFETAVNASVFHKIRAFDPRKPSTKSCKIFGPTSDSADRFPDFHLMPDDLEEGDRVSIANAGAYTVSTGMVGYNGILPIVNSIIN